MDRLTGALIAAALAIGAIALRGARRGTQSPEPPPEGPPAGTSLSGQHDRGIVLRNGPIDDGIAVRSPFRGDAGIVRLPNDGPTARS